MLREPLYKETLSSLTFPPTFEDAVACIPIQSMSVFPLRVGLCFKVESGVGCSEPPASLKSSPSTIGKNFNLEKRTSPNQNTSCLYF